MKQQIVITALMFTIFTMDVIVLADPPASTNIAATINNYWQQAEFDQCANYVTNLIMTYSNYLPAKVAYVTFYLAAYDTDYDVLIQELEYLVDDVASQSDEAFDEIRALLQAELQDRQTQRNVLVNQRGLTIQEIQAERTPTNVWTGNEGSWPNLFLIQLSPTNALQ